MAGKAALTGNLNFINLPDLFQLLGGNGSTGSLYIRSENAPAIGRIYFDKGNPINAIDGLHKGKEAVYALFGWTEGNFEFYEEKINVTRAINCSRMEIVLDALKMIDDGAIKRVGTESQEKEEKKTEGSKGDGKGALPILKGPFIDYVFVIDEEEYMPGSQIIKEGGHGKWIWVILEGIVNITREVSGRPLTIARLSEGNFIGTFTSFLFQGNIRSATATTESEVRLGLLDNERLSIEFASLSDGFRTILLSLDRRLRSITDRAAVLSAQGENADELPKDKKPIIKLGSTKEKLYLITQGEASVVGRNSEHDLSLLTLGKGDFFGYVPFWDTGHEPHAATVFGSQDLKVNQLRLEKLQVEYDGLSSTFRNLIDNVSSNISLTTKMLYHINNGK